MPRAVGGVQVDHHVRVEVVQQPHHRARLRRLELDVVAVDVEPLRVGARALAADRAVLEAAAGQRDLLVAVGVVVGVHEQHHRRQPVGVLARGDVADQRQHRLLALDLAGVDVGLQVDAQPVRGQHGGRPRVGDAADHGQQQRPALEGVAEGRDVHEVRGGVHRVEERLHVVVAAGLGEVGAFGAGLQAVQRRGTAGLGGGRRGHESEGRGDEGGERIAGLATCERMRAGDSSRRAT